MLYYSSSAFTIIYINPMKIGHYTRNGAALLQVVIIIYHALHLKCYDTVIMQTSKTE